MHNSLSLQLVMNTMHKVAVLGAGMVGRAMALDLSTQFDITAFDINAHNLSMLPENISSKTADLSNFESYPQLLKDFDHVVCAVPGFMGYRALQGIIRAK